jgi:hypothetical protein
MPADSTDKAVEQQALNALSYLSPEEQRHVLEYINSIINLDKTKNDQGSSVKN